MIELSHAIFVDINLSVPTNAKPNRIPFAFRKELGMKLKSECTQSSKNCRLQHRKEAFSIMNSTEEPLALSIERDSVCAGDDCDAPHHVSIQVHRKSTLAQVLEIIRNTGYLARITGGCATWIVESDRPLAVVAEQWTTPRFLIVPDTLIATCQTNEGSHRLFFRYWCQVDPDRVFDALQAGRPLPDQYGRE